MKVIESKMVHAVKYGQHFKRNNTEVWPGGDVWLHGNHIATVHPNGIVTVNIRTLRQWPTVTTKSRLRALGVPVYQRGYNTYIGEQEIHDIPSDWIDV